MNEAIPYSAIGAAAAAIFTPIILSFLKNVAPGNEGSREEMQLLSKKYDKFEIAAFLAMWLSFGSAVIFVLSKKLEVDSFLLLFGSLAVLPTALILSVAATTKDGNFLIGFMRHQEIKYKMNPMLSVWLSLFMCILAFIGAWSLLNR